MLKNKKRAQCDNEIKQLDKMIKEQQKSRNKSKNKDDIPKDDIDRP